jgi:arylsulfatase A-like enzyme
MRFLYLLALLLLSCTTAPKIFKPKPNILVIMVDDLGWQDLSIYGAKDIKSPEIDSLMTAGMRFSDFTANCSVCSPSRASFLTGRFQDLVGVPGVIRTPDASNWGFMDPKAITLPDLLGKAGYRTSLIGKWHLGLTSPNLPNDRGFEEFKGFTADMMENYWRHRRFGKEYMFHNNKRLITAGTHATELFTQWAIEDLKASKKDGRPFFQFLAYNAPHSPIHPPKDWLQKFKKANPKASAKRAGIGALIEHLDHNIGRVLQSLKELNLDKNTLVIFTSDNGGKLVYGANNGPLRSDKTHMYEGGLKVCTSFTWPGKIQPAGLSDFRGMTMDLYPTILEVAGVEVKHEIEGRSILQEVTSGDQDSFTNRNQIYTWLQKYKKHALRKGDWKLVKDMPNTPYELFNLKNDPYEKNDLVKKNPQKFAELMIIMKAHLAKAGKVNWKRPSQKK